MLIEYLEWDSVFFNLKIGRYIITESFDYDTFEQIFKKSEYDIVYVICDKILQIKNSNIKVDLMDILITVSKQFKSMEYDEVQYKLYNELNNTELQQCYDISEQVAVVSRFYTETLIGDTKTKLMYKKWIDNALNKTYSDGIFIEKNGVDVAGVHIVKVDNENNIGYFTLTGVDKKLKQTGIGRKLWNQSYAYFKYMNVKKIISVVLSHSYHDISWLRERNRRD